MKYAEVIVAISNKNVDRIFHYKIPIEIKDKLIIGMRVVIPFGMGNKKSEGFVIGFSDNADVPDKKIKEILYIKDKYPLFDSVFVKLAFWMKEKYYSTLADCLKCIVPKVTAEKSISCFYINYDNPDINTLIEKYVKRGNQQSKVIEFLQFYNGTSLNELKIMLGVGDSTIKTLEKNNVIVRHKKESLRNTVNIDDAVRTEPLNLTEEQNYAVNYLKGMLLSENKKTVLINGVTGSGKTEIYLQIIDEVIKNGKQAVVLVPEISLTPQTVQRFISRFGDKATVTHSRLSDGERFDQWKKALNGEISIMIGPRSALFTPFKNLGIIIIDEEHESTYKSEITPKYDSREVAEKISSLTGALVVLGSATPSVESFYYSQIGKYELITLKNRVNNSFPDVEIVDMREELADGNRSIFSRQLLNQLSKNIETNMQTILFLNRRGYSNFVSCRSCGYVMSCDDCNVNFTYHIDSDNLICHYCGKTQSNPAVCPQCGSQYIRYFGVGTQKIEEEVQKLFPVARVIRMDTDTTKKKNSHETILKKFAEGGADILIGTQMIAKGLDFPNVTLVGVIAADISINNGDYRSAETTFQLLTQVSGRAGRARDKGRVFIQTYNPTHYSIVFASQNNYNEFYEHEIALRKEMLYPPFSNIFFIMFTGEDERKVISKLYKLLDIMFFYNSKKKQFELLGPAPAFISKIKKNYRWRVIVKGIDENKLKNFVIYCIDKLKEKEEITGININITMNPSYIQ